MPFKQHTCKELTRIGRILLASKKARTGSEGKKGLKTIPWADLALAGIVYLDGWMDRNLTD
jgi:hypothetical protein